MCEGTDATVKVPVCDCVLAQRCVPCIPEQPAKSPGGLGDSLSSRLSQLQNCCRANQGEVPRRALTPASEALRLRLQVPRGGSEALPSRHRGGGGCRDCPGVGRGRRRRRGPAGRDWSRRALSDSEPQVGEPRANRAPPHCTAPRPERLSSRRGSSRHSQPQKDVNVTGGRPGSPPGQRL